MSLQSVPPEIVKVFASILNEPPESVVPSLSTKTSKSWDSLKHVELVMAIEDQFGLRFSSTEVVLLSSVEGFMKLIEQKRSGTL